MGSYDTTSWSRYNLYHILFLVWVCLLWCATATASGGENDEQPPYVPPLQLEQGAFQNYTGVGSILIVGGGAAGLLAAYTLEYLGVTDYLVLEASNDFGGRVQQLQGFLDVPLDLGAEWVHVEPRILQELLLFDDDDDHSIETIVYQPQTIALVWRNLWGRLKLRKFNWLRFFYRDTKFYNTTWYSYLRDYIVPHVAEKMELNVVVSEIDYSAPNDVVTVKSRDGRVFTGDKVIVATPVTILQDRDISFVPGLPEEMWEEFSKIIMPPGLKAWIEFDRRFYPDAVVMEWSLKDESDDLVTKMYMDTVFRKPSERNALTLFQVGDTAAERALLSDSEILVSMLAELDEMFDGQASEHYVQHYIQNWFAEPFVRGSYSINSDHNRAVLQRPVAGRIYLAGEYMEVEHRATVHGAGISGRQVAQQLLLDAAGL